MTRKHRTASLANLVRDIRGDSLVEALAALLIAALATTLLVTMVLASTNVASTTRNDLMRSYDAQSAMDQTGIDTLRVRIDTPDGPLDGDIPVVVYTSRDGSYSRYEDAAGEGGGSS